MSKHHIIKVINAKEKKHFAIDRKSFIQYDASNDYTTTMVARDKSACIPHSSILSTGRDYA